MEIAGFLPAVSDRPASCQPAPLMSQVVVDEDTDTALRKEAADLDPVRSEPELTMAIPLYLLFWRPIARCSSAGAGIGISRFVGSIPVNGRVLRRLFVWVGFFFLVRPLVSLIC